MPWANSTRENSFSEPGGLQLSYEGYRTTTYRYSRENDSGKRTLPNHRLVNTSTGYLYTASAFYLGFPYGIGGAYPPLDSAATWFDLQVPVTSSATRPRQASPEA